MGINLNLMRRRLGIMAQPHRETQSGDLVTFTGIKAPLSVLAQIVPVQSGSGDPSPENERPITGWTGCEIPRTGKNLFDENGEYQYKKFIADNGATRTASSAPYPKLYSQEIPVVPGKSYSMSGKSQTNGYLRVCQYDSNNTFIKRSISSSTTNPTLTITTESNASYVIINPDENISDLQFEVGSVSAFSAYSGTTLSVDWTDTAGTVYGGTLTVNKDGTGVLTGEKGSATKTGNDVTTVGQASSGIYYAVLGTIQDAANVTESNKDMFKCNMYSISSKATINNAVRIVNKALYCYNNDLDTLEKAQAFYNSNPVQIVYPLAIPVTYGLTAEQVGQLMANNGVNNVWSNANGQITVNYWKH